MQRCKTCGREYSVVKAMTYSEYGYCSWDCLMNKKTRNFNQPRNNNRRNNSHRSEAGPRSKWAQNY